MTTKCNNLKPLLKIFAAECVGQKFRKGLSYMAGIKHRLGYRRLVAWLGHMADGERRLSARSLSCRVRMEAPSHGLYSMVFSG